MIDIGDNGSDLYEPGPDDGDDWLADRDVEVLEDWQADQLLARLGRVRVKIAHFEDQFREMSDRYERWLSRMTEPLLAQESQLSAVIGGWALGRVEADPKGPKSFDLPSGTVKTHQPPVTVQIPDEALFVLWAHKAGKYTLVRPPLVAPWKPDKRAIKEALEQGEKLEGAQLVQGVREVTGILTEGPPE